MFIYDYIILPDHLIDISYMIHSDLLMTQNSARPIGRSRQRPAAPPGIELGFPA